jgi:hypothetical protein
MFPLVVWILMTGGCFYSGGELLFLFGVGRGRLVKAEFRLTEGPLLVLIDDASQLVDTPTATRELFDELAQELLRHKATKKIIPRQTVEQLRQSMPDFEGRGCREVGLQAKAKQVLWIEVRDFLAEEQIQEVITAARFHVTVKVINVPEEGERARVRLWPTSPNGKVVTAGMAGSEVTIAKTKNAIAKELARRLAVKTAKLFYDHRLGEFEREP